MKVNVFGWPLFKGKVYADEEEAKVFSFKSVGSCWLTFKNNLTAISITDKEEKRVDGFIADAEWDTDMARSLMKLAARACGIKPANVTDESVEEFMTYIVTCGSPLSSLKYNLETESVTINGFGFYVTPD